MAENAAVIENASGHLKVAKPSPKSHARVDGIIALIMALALSADAENAPPTPEPEILVL
jgi:phage terminase large subunit-like protein